ncbi:serine/threonine-protein kinase [Rugamonas sp.]|uniref:serine/threonine-protein kinase n=1 Tax=Rugamonas sp. TaxID=1926287 RepID=UPI0025D3B543|nr:serine/threonine-protein kinase [Rugamonas sp.]
MLEHLGKYRIDSILGKGAMGVVYKAFDPHIERVVALKTIRKELFSDAQQADLISRFKNEAQAAGRLQHPNIVMVYDYGEDSESAYIAMEFVDGTALNTLMVPDQPTALPRINAWMGDLLLALEYAHSRGVVHRDIKPANLLITSAAQVKVSDFGIARIESSTLTQTGSMIGTPSYMSPEQFRGETVDGRSDVFSAGILLYQMLTGVRPFVGSPSIVMQQILNEMPAPPSRVLPALGTGYDRILERALAKAPAERYASARAFLDALNQAGQPDGADPDATAMGDADRTVMAAGLRFNPAPQAGPATGAGLGTGTGSNTMTPWKLEAFPELDTILSRQIGPMAKFLLKKVAAQADGIDDLCDLLLPHIPSDVGRLEFQASVALLKKKLAASGTGSGAASTRTALGSGATGLGMRTGTGTGTGTGVGGQAGRSAVRAPVAYDDAFIDSTVQKLTVFIGPIAKVVAKRAARQTNDRNDFLRLVAEHIDVLPERARFLSENGVA